MTEFVDSMGIYAFLAGSDATASQDSLLTRYNGLGGGSLCVLPTGGVRGNPVLEVPFGQNIFKTVSHQSTYTAGFNANVLSEAGVGGADLFQFLNNDTIMCSLKVNDDGSILIYAFNDISLSVLSTGVLLNAEQDNYIELQVTCTVYDTDKLAMFAQLWINGVSQGSATLNTPVLVTTLVSQTGIFGNNPVPNSPAVFNRFGFFSGVQTPGRAWFSDFYLTNTAGTTNLGPFGIVAIDAYPLPDGDGGISQWTPFGGTGPHFSQINELPADGDASYVSSATPGQKDSYTWQDIVTFDGTVKTVQLSFSARINDEGLRTFQTTIGNMGEEEQGPEVGPPSDYVYTHQCFDVDPATGLAWTVAGFNAKQFGIGLVE